MQTCLEQPEIRRSGLQRSHNRLHMMGAVRPFCSSDLLSRLKLIGGRGTGSRRVALDRRAC
jgi:hypothetical protein